MSIGKLKLVINPAPEKVWEQDSDIISIRKESNTSDVSFHYENFEPASIAANQVLYQEGLPNDPSQTYIVISSLQAVDITNTAGDIELHIVSNGKSDQLDKSVDFMIGNNDVSAYINFESRPDTLDINKSTTSYINPITITAADILGHFSDFDGDQIVEFAIETGSTTNFKYDGVDYVSGTFMPISTLDAVGLVYHPTANPLGYNVEFPWVAKDSKGNITVA